MSSKYIVCEETEDDPLKVVSINHETLDETVRYVNFNTGRHESYRNFHIFKVEAYQTIYKELPETLPNAEGSLSAEPTDVKPVTESENHHE